MANLYELHSNLLQDRRITDNEVSIIREYIESDDQLDMQDVKFLVELLSDAEEVSPAFDDLFFPLLKNVMLADGKISLDEHYYLLKMLYADGHVRDREREFLLELRQEAHETSPEFDALCVEILDVPDRNWSLGGYCR